MLKSKNGFKPRTTGLARAGRLPQTSEKMRTTIAEKRKAYRVVAAEQDCCFTCGNPYDLQNSHILTQKQHPEHRANPRNIVRECPGCHLLWENQKAAYADRWPAPYAAKLDRMQEIKPSAASFFLLKNPGSPVSTPSRKGERRALRAE
ncbi:MAG: hypothetical protein ACRYFZ_09670 [Janthinobacterium lividum]